MERQTKNYCFKPRNVICRDETLQYSRSRQYFPLIYYILKACLVLIYIQPQLSLDPNIGRTKKRKEFRRKNQSNTHGSNEQCYLCVVNVERKQPETDVDVISNSFVAKLRKKRNIF